jgi:hypothetical protein
MALAVRGGLDRNRRTACRNTAAPRRAVASIPPSRSTTAKSAAAAPATLAPPPPAITNPSRTPRRLSASTTNAPNSTSTPAWCAPDGTSHAPRRRSRTRSSARAPSPRTHPLTAARLTPRRRATAAIGSPPFAARAPPTATSADDTIPGRASNGSTRSRWPHSTHPARRTSSTTHPPGRCSFRLRESGVSHSSKLPHKAQRQPARSRHASAPATASAYWVE